MKSVVVYYSLSGNNRKIAKAIHRGMSKVVEADVGSIKEISPKDLAKYDLIGVGAPIWYMREPANVRLYLHRIPKMEGKYFFLFSCHGLHPYGIFMTMSQVILKKDAKIIGWADWFGDSPPGDHWPYPSPKYGHPDEIDLAEAEKFGREIAERALQIASGRTHLIPEIPKGPYAPPLWRAHPIGEPHPGTKVARKINKEKCKYPSCTLCQDLCPAECIDLSLDQPFMAGCWNDSLCNRICPFNAIEVIPEERAVNLRSQYRIDMTRCNYPECKLCVVNCPMDSIDFTTSPPTIKYNCEGCEFCYVICPTGAIERTNEEKTHKAKWEQEVRSRRKDLEMLIKEMEEKMGFRLLIPFDKIGWDTPGFSIKQRPLFRIPEDP